MTFTDRLWWRSYLSPLKGDPPPQEVSGPCTHAHSSPTMRGPQPGDGEQQQVLHPYPDPPEGAFTPVLSLGMVLAHKSLSATSL